MHFRTMVCSAAALLVLTAGMANAQDWPNRPMTMVVPFAAGGPMDSLARILQPTLSEALGQQIIIENKTALKSVPYVWCTGTRTHVAGSPSRGATPGPR